MKLSNVDTLLQINVSTKIKNQEKENKPAGSIMFTLCFAGVTIRVRLPTFKI